MNFPVLLLPLIILGCVLGNELSTRQQMYDDAITKGNALSYQSIKMGAGVSHSHKQALSNFQPQELPLNNFQSQQPPQQNEAVVRNYPKPQDYKKPLVNVDYNKNNFKQQFTPTKFTQTDFKPSTFIPQKPEPHVNNKGYKTMYLQPKQHTVKNPLLNKKPMRVVKRRIKIEGNAPYIYHSALHRMILSSILSTPPHLTRK